MNTEPVQESCTDCDAVLGCTMNCGPVIDDPLGIKAALRITRGHLKLSAPSIPPVEAKDHIVDAHEMVEAPSEREQKPPQHAFEVRITIGANEAPYVARALSQINETIERSGIAGAMSGGWDGSWSIDVRKRDVTPDQYRQELENWRQGR